MTIETIKFSEFLDGGDLENGSTTVGLDGGSNAFFNNPWTFLQSGTTAERPAIAADMYYRLRFNTTAPTTYEFYDPTAAAWVQIEDSADINDLIARLAAHTVGDGASMIGLEDQGLIVDKTVQDLAEAAFIAQTSNGTLNNAQFLDALATGFLSSTTGTGVVESRTMTGTASEIDVANGDGSGVPTFSLSSTVDTPGTFTIGTTIVLDSIIDDDTFGTATATNVPTAESVKAYVDSTGSGLVDSVTGTANQVDVNNADAANPILLLSSTIDAPGTFTIQASTAVNAIINDETMASATNQNLSTSTAIKTYVDSIASGGFTVILTALIGTTANLSAAYANGASGVGATLTNNSTQVALTIDGVLTQVADRVLVKDQTAELQNGVYTVTTLGDGSTNWVLTRATDYDTAAEIIPGTLVPVSSGTVNGGSIWLETATVGTVGTDPVIFSEFAAPSSTYVTIATVQTVSGAKTFSANVALSGGSTLNLNSTTSIDGFIDDDSFATASATTGATSESIKAYVDSTGGGLVDSVTGTANQVDVNNADTENPIVLLSSTIDTPGTFDIQSTTTVDSILDEDDMSSDSATALATQQSIKAYVDAQVGGSGGFQSYQIFTSSGTWTKPSGINNVLVQVIGGGGGGATGATSGATTAGAGSGGGAGGFSQEYIDVTGTASESVTVGSAGAGGVSSNGSPGGSSSFGSFCSATGGGGGKKMVATTGYGSAEGGLNGVGSGGDLNCAGAAGLPASASTSPSGPANFALSGSGGASFYGGGGAGVQTISSTVNGIDGVTPGSGGGGGAQCKTVTAGNGGAGAAGMVVVYEYS